MKPIRDFLLQASTGELSEPIPLPSGWGALVLAESVEAEGVMPFSEAQLTIRDMLLKEQAEAIFRESINRLRQRCYLWGPRVDIVLDSLVGETSRDPEEEL